MILTNPACSINGSQLLGILHDMCPKVWRCCAGEGGKGKVLLSSQYTDGRQEGQPECHASPAHWDVTGSEGSLSVMPVQYIGMVTGSEGSLSAMPVQHTGMVTGSEDSLSAMPVQHTGRMRLPSLPVTIPVFCTMLAAQHSFPGQHTWYRSSVSSNRYVSWPTLVSRSFNWACKKAHVF
jgi:hypothetical protein